MGFTKEQILEIEKKLAQLPEHEKTENLNKLEALRLLHKTIMDLKNKGYSTKTIANILTENNFEISSTLLTSYLSIIRKKRNTRPKKTIKNDNKIIPDNSNYMENVPTIEPSTESVEIKQKNSGKNSSLPSSFVNISDSEKL